MTRVIYLKAGGGYDNVFLGNQDISNPMNDEAQIRLHRLPSGYAAQKVPKPLIQLRNHDNLMSLRAGEFGPHHSWD